MNYGLGDWGPCLEIRSNKQTGPEKPIPLTHMHVISVMSCHVMYGFDTCMYHILILCWMVFFFCHGLLLAVLYSFSCFLYTILANGKPKANNNSCTKNVCHKHGHMVQVCLICGINHCQILSTFSNFGVSQSYNCQSHQHQMIEKFKN